MNGKIEQVINTGNSWQAHGKSFYDFNYIIGGVTYVMSHIDNAPKFAVGEELEFEITRQGNPKGDGTVWPSKIKKTDAEFQTNSNGFAVAPAKKATSNNRSFALSYAKDLAVSGQVKMDHLFPLADKMVQWLDEEENKPAPVAATPPPPPVPEPIDEHDGLPF